jgi:ComF family protein
MHPDWQHHTAAATAATAALRLAGRQGTSSRRLATLSGALRRLADAWLPRTCALCDGILPPEGEGLCTVCLEHLPGARAPRCPVCALRVAPGRRDGDDDGDTQRRDDDLGGCSPDASARPCDACATRPPAYARTVALADYAPPLDRLVLALKFGGELALARPLGLALAPPLAAALRSLPAGSLGGGPPLLVPVPLARERLAGRGFNQAQAIAAAAARALRLPLAPGTLERRRETAVQSTLALADRHANLAGAFEANGAAAGRCVVLVDDVMTSGATLQAAAQAMRDAGAQCVLALVAARTPP